MTPRGATAAATAAVLAVAGRVLGIVELTALAAGLVAVLAVLLLRTWARPRPALEVARRAVPAVVHAGGSFRVELTVGDGSGPGQGRGLGRATPELTLVESVDDGRRRVALGVAPLRRGERRQAAYRLPAPARGRLWVGPLRASRGDALGFTRRQWVALPPEALLVLPEVREGLHLPAALAGADGQEAGGRATAGGTEFRALRPYVRGDDPRRVHWRSSARTGDLVVREDETTAARPLAVVLDTVASAGPGPAFELAVSIAASLVVAGARPDRAVLLVVGTTPPRTVRADPVSVRRALVALAEVAPADGNPEPAPGNAAVPAGTAFPSVPAGADAFVVTAADAARAQLLLASASPGAVLLRADPDAPVAAEGIVRSLDDLAARWSGTPRHPQRRRRPA